MSVFIGTIDLPLKSQRQASCKSHGKQCAEHQHSKEPLLPKKTEVQKKHVAYLQASHVPESQCADWLGREAETSCALGRGVHLAEILLCPILYLKGLMFPSQAHPTGTQSSWVLSMPKSPMPETASTNSLI